MISLEGEEATHKSELTVNRSRKNLSETFHPLPASLSHAPVRNRTFILQHACPMLNHRAMSHIIYHTVMIRPLRLQIK
ncbi:hypothetical protein OUZ56_026840 [Daphnia magna]|uniref:Uncharacterized protein n=1 Tax=Daphnia magna TaxID=35525 RepID=A0ABQ9ZMZ0_9CRUS|nr:hypothetical protein OUZ56_026840 [Daphnia magna]